MMMMMNNNNLLFLPADITIDILARLPVESVLQCKHVCRTWQTLINDPVFGHTHTLLHHNTNNNSTSFDFLLCTSSKGMFEYSFGEYNIIHHPADHGSTFRHKKPINLLSFPLDIERSYNYNQRYLLPADSYNGLICLVSNYSDDYNMCVYNPLTREYVNLLPRFNIPISNNGGTSKMFGDIATGFGYHPGTKEYKIVRIYYVNPCSPGQVSVYTLGSGSGWRNKGETSHLLYGTSSGRRSGVFVNGALHWLAKGTSVDQKEENNKYIVSFDLVDEEFRIIPSPPSRVHDIQLGVFEGCLSATGRDRDWCRGLSKLWIMKHKDCSWCKKFEYGIPCDEPGDPNFLRKRNEPGGPNSRQKRNEPAAPLALFKVRGKVLLHYSYKKLFCYDPITKSMDHVRTTNLVNPYTLIPYTKTFTSLKALGEDGARIGRTATTNTRQQLIISRKRKTPYF